MGVVAQSSASTQGLRSSSSKSVPTLDYIIEENSLKEIGRMTVEPQDHANRLIEGLKAAD
jgi:hypothetical protein